MGTASLYNPRLNLMTFSTKWTKTIFLLELRVKPVLVATSIKQATCIKQECIHFPQKKNKYIKKHLYLASTCLKKVYVDYH